MVQPDSQIAKFNDKFSMKTALQWDPDLEEYRDKPSTLQVFLLETDEEEMFTGQEIDMGTVPLNLASYAKESHVTEKLTLGNPQDVQF